MVFVDGTRGMQGSSHDHASTDWSDYSRSMRDDDRLRRDVLTRLQRGIAHQQPTLFDIGAGSGEFLHLARSFGFQASGNDISPTAIAAADERYGIKLDGPDLSAQAAASFDVVTMWCVLPHVAEPVAMLQEVRRLLRPGGVLFLRVPRRCLIDHVAVGLAKGTRGRVSDLADWRVTPGHSHLFGNRSMALALEAAGYSSSEVESHCHYSLTSEAIVARAPTLQRLRIERVMDSMINRNLFPRNALLAFARA